MNRINNFDMIKNLQIIDFSLDEIYKNVNNFNPNIKHHSNTAHVNKISSLEHHLEGGSKQQEKYNHFPVNYSENYDTETSQTNFNVINYLSLGKNSNSFHINNTKRSESSIFVKQSHKTPTSKRTRKNTTRKFKNKERKISNNKTQNKSKKSSKKGLKKGSKKDSKKGTNKGSKKGSKQK